MSDIDRWRAAANTLPDLERRVKELETAIRKHRDYRGDDRCYQDDAELYTALPEGDTRPPQETAITTENCQKYIACRQTGQEYVSLKRRIEELENVLRPFVAMATWRRMTTETFDPERCPICGKRDQTFRRHGLHFERMLRCGRCDRSYDPEEEYEKWLETKKRRQSEGNGTA